MTVRTIINDDPTEYDFDGVKNTLAKERHDEVASIDDEDVWDRIYEYIDCNYNDELHNLNVKTEGNIIAIASLDLWNGRCLGYAILDKNNLKEILYCGNEDYNHLYYDGFNVYKKAIHRDGINKIVFREVRPDEILIDCVI